MSKFLNQSYKSVAQNLTKILFTIFNKYNQTFFKGTLYGVVIRKEKKTTYVMPGCKAYFFFSNLAL